MLMIDNTSKLKNIMEFKQDSYYKFVALIRAKDYKDFNEQVLRTMEKQEILVRDWMVDSEEMLDKLLPDMLKYTELFKCRLYMCTDRKSVVKTLVQMRNNVNNYLDPFLGNPNASCSVRALRKIGSSASSLAESSDRENRYWMFDVDTKNESILNYVINDLCADNYVETFETKAGYHVLAKKKFHPTVDKQYNDYVDTKDNAMVLVAMGE